MNLMNANVTIPKPEDLPDVVRALLAQRAAIDRRLDAVEGVLNGPALAKLANPMRPTPSLTSAERAAVKKALIESGSSGWTGTYRQAEGAPAPKPKGKRRRGRGSFPQTGEESILAFVGANRGADNAQLRRHWKSDGRSGVPDNALSKLCKDRKLVRTAIRGQRGSRYSLA